VGATTIIAAYAAVVSTASFIVALRAYRTTDPRVSIDAFVVPASKVVPAGKVVLGGKREDVLRVVVSNSGRSDTTVNIDGLTFLRTPGFEPADKLLGFKRRSRFMPLAPTGPNLPHRLRGHDTATWDADLDRINWDLDHELRPSDEAAVVLHVGARRRLVRVRHYEPAYLLEIKRRAPSGDH